MSAFGIALRRRRKAAGLSLAELANRVHYDKGYLSKLENGVRRPSGPLARTLDVALETDGELIALLPEDGMRGRGAAPAGGPAFAAELLPPCGRPDAERAEVAGSVCLALESARALGRTTRPDPLLRTVAGLTDAVIGALGRDDRDRPLFRLAARCAEFAGWMAQECGAWTDARNWTARAAELDTDDPTFLAYTSVRQAEIALYTGHPDDVLGWAADALEAAGAGPDVRALALFREAQGHAALGNAHRCRRALDRGATLYGGGPATLGSTSGIDQHAAARGWCAHDLGRHAEASELLAGVVRRIPARSRRIRAVLGARLAAAQAAAGERELAGATCRRVLDEVSYTASASALTQLDAVHGHLRRWPRDVPSQRLALDVAEALHRRQSAEAVSGPSPGRRPR